MLTLTVVLLLSAEPDRFLGGAAPHPMTAPGPVDTSPSGQACTTLTLRHSSKCFLDGRATVVTTDAARKTQAKNNLEAAKNLARGLCNERLEPGQLEPKEKKRRMDLCVAGATSAATSCSLDGAEVLLDAEGRFSKQAGACYDALATALQSADVPPSSP